MIRKPSGYLTGQFLLSMPQLEDIRFKRTVIYMCGHDKNGAMGIIVNKPLPAPSFAELFLQIGLPLPYLDQNITIHRGGPVESDRGFILHSVDYMHEATIQISDSVALTATVDVLKALSQGSGPKQYLIALGYAGWGAGQLESELLNNSWLTAEATSKSLFTSDPAEKWEEVMLQLGVNSQYLAYQAGHA